MKLIYVLSAFAVTLALTMPADAGFGGSRGGFSGSRSSSFGGSRSSSFGGSRSSPSRSYSAPSRSYSAPSKSYTAPSPSKSSSFGGSRSSSSPAPIVRPNRTNPTQSGFNSGTVTHNYYNHGYGGGSGFYHGMMFGYLFNRPQTVYLGGQNVIVGDNGQPVIGEDGRPVVYENTHPFLTFLGTLVMLAIIGALVYFAYKFFKGE